MRRSKKSAEAPELPEGPPVTSIAEARKKVSPRKNFS
jgi:hypothetical protein